MLMFDSVNKKAAAGCKSVLKILVFLLSTVVLGCSVMPTEQPSTSVAAKGDSGAYSQTLAALNQESAIYKKLNTHYQRWRGTPYELGSMNKGGIDCSGFVYLTFRNQLGRPLPRTTKAQYANSRKISKSDLQAGDLVFFKTGSKQLHVGIYLTEGRFLHASSSKGVMVSSLSNVYWHKNFLSARRI